MHSEFSNQIRRGSRRLSFIVTKQINWLRGNVKDLNPDSDLIPYEESNARLIIFGAFLACFFSLISTILLCKINSLTISKIVILETRNNAENSRFVMPQIFLLDSNSILFKIKNSDQKEKQFKLQDTKKRHFMIQRSYNSIGFIRDDMKIDMITYYLSGEHFTLGDSSLPESLRKYIRPDKTLSPHQTEERIEYFFKHAVQLGSNVWFNAMDFRLEGNPAISSMWNLNVLELRKTLIWNIKKERWMIGPLIPEKIISHGYCLMALNSTVAVFLGGIQIASQKQSVDVFNFETYSWSQLPNIDLSDPKNHEIFYEQCFATLAFEKNGDKKIFLQVNHFDIFLESSQSKLMSLKIGDDHWNIVGNFDNRLGLDLIFHMGNLVSIFDKGPFHWTDFNTTKLPQNIDETITDYDFNKPIAISLTTATE